MAHYTNIPPGRYRFEVRASNADGFWNETGAAIDGQRLIIAVEDWLPLPGASACYHVHRGRFDLRKVRLHAQTAHILQVPGQLLPIRQAP